MLIGSMPKFLSQRVKISGKAFSEQSIKTLRLKVSTRIRAAPVS